LSSLRLSLSLCLSLAISVPDVFISPSLSLTNASVSSYSFCVPLSVSFSLPLPNGSSILLSLPLQPPPPLMHPQLVWEEVSRSVLAASPLGYGTPHHLSQGTSGLFVMVCVTRHTDAAQEPTCANHASMQWPGRKDGAPRPSVPSRGRGGSSRKLPHHPAQQSQHAGQVPPQWPAWLEFFQNLESRECILSMTLMGS
jgi:hypothetical protein